MAQILTDITANRSLAESTEYEAFYLVDGADSHGYDSKSIQRKSALSARDSNTQNVDSLKAQIFAGRK